MTEEDIDIRQRFAELKIVDQLRDDLIERLLRRVEKLDQDYQQKKLDHARETQFNRDVQLRELQLGDELRTLKAIMARDPFILVLIDGDGMIFEDHLLKKGEAGGKESASILWSATRDYVHQVRPDLSSDFKIVVRIYANLKGLGDICHRASILENPATMENFARGFTGGKQLFDFVDVGQGKDRADDKISEIFKLHLYDCHCRHIFFGCSHDNGYARLLEDVADQHVMKRITLLEGVPFEKELHMLKSKYETTRFEGVFRESKIHLYPQQYYQQAPPPSMNHTISSPSPLQPVQYQSPYQPVMSRTSPAPPTNASSMNPMANSWASAANAARVASPPPTPQPTPTHAVVPRNRYGQRIDSPMKYDHSDVKRVKDIHMCNVHFLREDCPFGEDCTHDHTYKPNKNELQTLKYVARLTPCRFGSECDDVKCIYGHRCPIAEPGKKDCRFGNSCRFERDLHGIDLNVVKTTRIGGK